MTEKAEASRKEKTTESDSLNEAMMEKAETSLKNSTEPASGDTAMMVKIVLEIKPGKPKMRPDSLTEAMMEKAETSLKNSTEPDSGDEAMRLKRAEIREGKKKMRPDSLTEAMKEKTETSLKNSTEPDSLNEAMMVKRLVIRQGKKRMCADPPTEVMLVEIAESGQQKKRMRANSGNEATSVEQAQSSQQTTVMRRDFFSRMLPIELILDICDNLCAQDRCMLMRTCRGLFAMVMGYLWKPGPYCHRAQRFLALKYKGFINSYGREYVFGSSHAGAVLWAVKHKQPELARRALQFRAVRTQLVEMLLRPATRGSDACPELLELLVNYLPNRTDVINWPGVPFARPLLFLAATRDIFDVLLRHGACPNTRVGGLPIIFTLGIEVGRKCAPLLLEYGADVLTAVNGMTPLTMAAESDAAYLLPVLTNAGVDIHAVEPGVPTALCYAARATAENCIRVLLEGGSDPMARWPGLDYAHALVEPRARERVWPMFLDHGLPVNMPAAGGQTMLMMAVEGRQIGLVNLLLQRGANVTVEDNHGRVAVDFACLGMCVNSPGKLEMLSDLIRIGCRGKRGDNDARWCAPWRAAVASRCWALVRRILKEDGFDPCAVDLAGQNLFMHVARQGSGSPLRDWLLSEHPAAAASWKRAMRQTDEAGHTALYWAVQWADARVVQRFLDMGADPATRAGDGRPLLAVAARRGAAPAMVSALLAGGADVHARDADGRTALSHAAENVDRCAMWEIVRELIVAGARDTDVDERGRRPVDWAARGWAEDFTAAVAAARTPGTWTRMEMTPDGVEFVLNEYF